MLRDMDQRMENRADDAVKLLQAGKSAHGVLLKLKSTCITGYLTDGGEGGDNKLPMLEKHLYDSWKSRMELYMMNRPHGRMILASVEKGPLVWPTITEDGARTIWENIRCSCKRSLTKAKNESMPLEQFQVNTKFLNTLPVEWGKFVTDVKLVEDLHTTNVDQIHAHLEHHERHANEV
ncbi:hypothetical protein Tco_1482518 [Tanacetum coccineum]